MYYNVFCKESMVIQPLTDFNAAEATFPSRPVKRRHLNFAFTRTEHHSPSKQSSWTRGKLWLQSPTPQIAEGAAFCRTGICTSKLIRWVHSLSGNCSNTCSQGRFYPTPFVSDVCLLMFKHFLLYLENSRSWLGTKISLLHMTCICTASMFHSASSPK